MLSLLTFCSALAQQKRFVGVVVDEETGDSIPFVSMQYKKLKEMYKSNAKGKFDIPLRAGQDLTLSAVGYKTQRIEVSAMDAGYQFLTLRPEAKSLQQVEVSVKKGKYSRKNNPAVELMRRVIAANKANNLKKNHEYYKYTNYQKITLALNDINAESILRMQMAGKKRWYTDQVMYCPQNDKLVLPFSMDETVTECAYRQSTDTERNTRIGQKTQGVNTMVETGQIVNKIANELFADVDIFNDHVKMLQFPFISPIGSGSINFYRFYIADTIMVGSDRCIHLEFLPNNQQDFGFRGQLYVLDDSTLHVRRCALTIPKKSDVNWVDEIKIDLEYEKLATGDWVLTKDDMFCELSIVDFLPKAAVFRSTRRTDYSFDPLPDELFAGYGKDRDAPDFDKKDDTFWTEHRTATLMQSEENLPNFIQGMKGTKGFGFLLTAFKVLTENYIELGTQKHPSYVDLGPINTFITYNFVDGLRTRISLVTTPRLSKHFFLKGYGAYGWKSHKFYYNATLTYSFNAKKHTMDEYPIRKISVTSGYDNMAPSDRFGAHDKDNFFTMFKWSTNEQRLFYNQKKVAFEWEQRGGLRYYFHYNWEKQSGVGTLEYPDMKISEFQVALTYNPGQNFVNTKQHRVTTNHDHPEYGIYHTIGVPGIFGSTQRYNITELTFYHRLWFNNWGRLSLYVKGAVQWNKVHTMQLLEPPVNTSFIAQRQCFNLMGDMEFLTDRYAMLDVEWDLYGRLFNRIPLFKKLKLRESLGFKALWGTLTEKNMESLPAGSRLLDIRKPYMEIAVGIKNILKFFEIQYVHRLTYNDNSKGSRNGVRIRFEVSF